ncbi:lipopolysaccharide core heptose(I) kinase RfaP [Methylophaga sp. OBS3]|uniref:lipopolysaccharide core heptose(I) kinase RfaP n=1 Tax=Methylophaga sp. OBS3 TaxID=2991934 RepID=UPI00225AB596|nr:lipopolysaccharide core heptose(I) kinase RfaP [Methylophaga sp. OBS3]MCX4190753.1 lipopolysaccharide core heptose(I) kinase RfaP [Methylophaga sp. OBS3]
MNNDKLFLRKEFQLAWANKSVFSQVKSITGDVFRDKEGRRTLRFDFQNHSYFLKYHAGIGWQEVFKNLIAFRLPIFSARNEWQAIQFLEKLGLDTMTLAAYGEKGWNPAKRQSFVITDELTKTMSLEWVGEQWQSQPPTFQTKQTLISKLAHISRVMHTNGINHRDFYLCHFLLDESFASHNTYTEDMPIYLIDLHRAQIRKKIPERWLVKDLGSLFFSASRVPLTSRDLLRFMKQYSGLPLRELLQTQSDFWKHVQQRAETLLAE